MDHSTSERIGGHLRANAIAYLALFAALTLGPAWAATPTAQKNTVNSKSIVNDSVTGNDVKESTLSGVPGANGGTLTQVNTGAGLTGGPITSAGTIDLTDCPNNQILKSTGNGWECANDVDTDTDTNSGGTVTSVGSGAGLTGGPVTGAGTLALTPCPNDQMLRSNGTGYACDTDRFASQAFFFGGSTQSVAGGMTEVALACACTTVITNLTGGVVGQRVTLVATDSGVDINDAGNFQLAGNWAPDLNDTLTVVLFNPIFAPPFWFEVARSNN